MRPSLLVLVAALVMPACKPDPVATSEPVGSSAPTSVATSTAGTAVTAARPSTEIGEPTLEARLARPKEIVLTVLHAFAGEVQATGIENGVVVCEPSCTFYPGQPIKTWLVTRAGGVEDPRIQPRSEGLDVPIELVFHGRWPDDARGTVWSAEARSGASFDVEFDGSLWRRAKTPPKESGPRQEQAPPPEVLAEIALPKGKSVRNWRVAWGGGAPTIAVDLDERQAYRYVNGARQLVTAINNQSIGSVHRLENGYTLADPGQTAQIVDHEAKDVPLRIEGDGVPPRVADARYTNVDFTIVGNEAWIVAILDGGKPSARTLILAASPGLLSTFHAQLRVTDPKVDLLNGRTPWKLDWKPIPAPASPGKGAGSNAPP